MKLIARHAINDEKWNDCVKHCSANLVYAFTWYLDEICPNWQGVITENDQEYLSCFPVPQRKKFGINYIYPPFFIQQLGLFSRDATESALPYLHLLSSKFKWIELNLNYLNQLPTATEKCNLILSLKAAYATILSRYSSNHKRNLTKAQNQGIQIVEEKQVDTAIALFRQDKGQTLTKLKQHHYQSFKKVCQIAHSKGLFFGLSAIMQDKTICSALFFKYKNRITFIFSGNSQKGKETGALFLLLDAVIQKYANQNFLLDFEGSENEGLQRFYKGFGSIHEPYYFIKQNQLGFPYNLIKK